MITFFARLDTPTVIVMVLAFGAVISTIWFIATLFTTNQKSKRIKQVISQHRGYMSSLQNESLRRGSAIRSRKGTTRAELAQKIVFALKLQNLLDSRTIREDLAQAGLRGRNSVILFVASRVVLAVLGFVLILSFVTTMPDFPYPDFVKFIFAGLGGIVGFFLPKLLVYNNKTKRQFAMAQAFPDALDLLLICVESGLGVEMALNKVTEEIMEN